jgi:hypothetical protein
MSVGAGPMIAIWVAINPSPLAMILRPSPQARCNQFAHEPPISAIPTPDDCKPLYVRGAVTSGVQRWTRVATGEESGSVGVTVNLADPDAGFVVVRFNLNGDPRVQEIQLESRPMRYGGRRYYFICPKHGRRCKVLPMVGGVFASRQAGRLTYQSQSADQIDRMRDRAHSSKSAYGPTRESPGREGGIGSAWPRRGARPTAPLKTCSPRLSCAAETICFRTETRRFSRS